MAGVVIENPVINSPFAEPSRHFVFDENGITDQIADERRRSSYFIPIPPPKKKNAQVVLPGNWTSERVKENEFINNVRSRVRAWAEGGYTGVTRSTRELLDYWQRPDRERRLFFCQLEALETAIYLMEVAPKSGQAWIANDLRSKNAEHNPGLDRVALKMATGTGKTVVMAMLIAWQALNKLVNPRDARFSDTFLVVTPGITIRDRLRVLLPNDPNTYYEALDLITPDQLTTLQQTKVLITNYHAFIRREKLAGVATLTKKVLAGPDGDTDRFKETPDEMVRRVCRDLGTKKNIVVLNDESHHCYRPRTETDADAPKLIGDERKEAERDAAAARVWISGLEAVKRKVGVRTIYDLSATPFFLRGSGYPEGTLFPWVVSDFSLIDAIESGIVKVPRVPVADDQMTGDLPTYRDLWLRIRDDLPKRGRKTEAITAEPKPPKALEGALRSLYGNYDKAYKKWEAVGAGSPPVFIVVCNNTNVSKLVYDWISGWEKPLAGGSGSVVVPGNLPVFSNEHGGGWRDRPNTLLIDSAQLESGEGMSDEFKKVAAREIERFKDEYRQRFPGRDVEELTDEDLLREVMNTVGKSGRLGEHVKCVVSVSMLTEGWDANTVTHILGVRAFGTQLLCEQVVGRGLRRMSYEPNDDGMFEPEYAEVYGVPFSFIPTAGTNPDPKPPKVIHRVRAMDDRAHLEITFPRLIGYRYEMPAERLVAQFNESSRLVLSSADVPTKVEVHPIVGTWQVHDLDDLKTRRMQEVAFIIARITLDYFKDDDGNERPWLFPQLVDITKTWLDGYLTCKGGTFPQMVVLVDYSYEAARKIYGSVVRGTNGDKRLLPILRPYEPIGSTAHVGFDTTKNVMDTDPKSCHINYVVADTKSWEQKMAEVLEGMPDVRAYVKNQGLGFLIPYAYEGTAANYMPDFIVRVNDGHDDLLNLIVEVSGEPKKEKAAKVATAKDLWVPAVNNHGGSGRWAFVEVSDPWDAEGTIRSAVGAVAPAGGG